MKELVIMFLVVAGTQLHGFAQETLVQGIVTGTDGEPIPGANVILENTYDGTSSDADGKFSFKTSETGDQVLTIRFVGYGARQFPITLNGQVVNVNATLKEEINQLEAVTITAGSFTASDAARRTVLRAVDIATTAGATADIAGALNTLPGTQKVGETGRLFVRGGDGNEAKTFIDGMLVFDAYGPAAPNTPSRGRFLPFMFKGTSFSTGGYSAEYGQALSSALVLDSKDESEITRTDIGLLSVGGDVTHTQAWEGGSAAGKIQYTDIRPYFGLINQEIDWKTPPVSLEGIASFRQRTGVDGMFKFYGNFNESSFSLYNHDIDDFSVRSLYELRNSYRYANSSYQQSISKTWGMRSGISYSHIKNDVDVAGASITDTETGVHFKAVVDGPVSKSIETKAGMELFTRNFQYGVNDGAGDIHNSFTENITAVFSETDIYVTNRFVARLGGRFEHNAMTGEAGVDPRISIAGKTGKTGQVSFAWGRFRQSPQNKYMLSVNELTSEKSEHMIVNYQRIENNRTFRIEAYRKIYSDLVKFSPSGIPGSNGEGYAQGVELFVRDNRSVKNLDYWISYSFLDTKRNYLHFPYAATPTFASSHNASVVTKYFVRSLKSQLGATWSYASGRPYHDPNYAGFNSGRTPHYQDLSFNWSYLPKPNLIVYASCTNLTGRDNVFGYEFSGTRSEDGQFNSRAIRQPAPRFMFIGIFLTLSKDKSVNQLPTL